MKPRKHRLIVTAAATFAQAFTLMLSSTSMAGNTWDGGGAPVDGLYNWGDNANWDSDTPPAYGTLLTFAGSNGLASYNNDATSSIAGITFSSGAGAFTLSGSGVNLGGNITNNSSSLQTINLPLVLDANRTIATTSGNIALGGPISGSSTLIKTQGNTLIMHTAGSSFSRMQINTGTVRLGVNDALPTTGGLTISTGATAVLDLNGKTQTLGGTIVIGGTLAGTATISDSVGTGLLKLGNNISQNSNSITSVEISAAVDLNGATRSFTLSNSTSSFIVSGTISNSTGTAGLIKAGVGTLTLSGANTFNGPTTVSAGNLQISNALALQNSAIDTTASITGNASAGIILNGVTSPTFGGLTGDKNLASLFNTSTGNYGLVTNITLNPGTGADHTYSGVITDGAVGMTLTKTGAGRQVLSTANTYTGGTILNGGTLNYSNAGALSTGAITFTSGTILQSGVATTLTNPISVAANITGTIGTAGFATTLSGPITGDGTLAKGGAGVLTLTGGLSNTIAGGIRINTGRVDVLDGLSLTNTGTVTVLSGTTLNYSKNFASGNDLTNNLTLSGAGIDGFGALNLRGNANATGTITLAANATISHDFNNATISGSITGTDRNLTLTTIADSQPGMTIPGLISLGNGGLTVTGAANSGNFSIKLSGDNSYSGGTIVTSGTLLVTNTTGSATGSGTVTVNSGATLGGTGIIAGNIAATGSIAPGEGGIGTLKTGGDVTWNSGNAWKFNLSSTNATSDQLEITGALTKGSGGSFIFDFMGSTPKWGETYTLATFASTSFTLTDFDLANSLATLGAGSYSGSSFALSSTSLTFTAIPEPTSALASILLTCGLLRRRR